MNHKQKRPVNNTYKLMLFCMIGFNTLIVGFYFVALQANSSIKNLVNRGSFQTIWSIELNFVESNYTNTNKNSNDNQNNLQTCTYPSLFQAYSPNEKQRREVDKRELTFEEISANLAKISIKLVDGGKSFAEENSKCTTDGLKYRRVAFIIPYRNRLKNLMIFLNNMHLFWTRHNLTYGVYLIEPSEELTFNRGLLMNIGYLEAVKDSYGIHRSNKSMPYWDCFVFHDVDMIPEDNRLHYTCDSKYPLHYAVAVSKFGYK